MTNTAPAVRLVKRTGEDEDPDVIAYDVFLGEKRIGSIRRGRTRWVGIGDTYNPWEARSAKRVRAIVPTRAKAVAFVVSYAPKTEV